MSYITPNTDIWILKNVPLDKSYSHTYFPWDFSNNRAGTRNSQFNALVNYLKPTTTYRGKSYNFHLTHYSFQRKNRNVVNVKIPYDILFDCNYLIFKNTAYENKYFYAFIDSVDYINDNTSKITYTIDVMQTWHFDYALNYCFVEREHVASDNRGENILVEPVDVGGYNTYHRYGLLDLINQERWYIVFVCTFSTSVTFAPASGSFSGGTWNQCEYKTYLCYNPLNENDPDVLTPMQIQQDVNTWLNFVSVLNRTNAIITMYMCPEPFLPSTTYNAASTDKWAMGKSINECKGQAIDITARPLYPNWTPHNAKMFTYPYCFFTIDNNQGSIQEYRYENFEGCRTGSIQSGDILFNVYWNNAVKPKIRLVPVDYETSTSLLGPNFNTYEKCIDIDDFAIGTWAANDFMAKVVQGGIGLAITAATLGANSVAPGIAGVGKTLFNNAIANSADAKTRSIAMGEYLKQEDFLSSDTKEIIIDNIRNFSTKEEVPWGALAKDIVKTIGALSLMALRSNIKSSMGNGNINLTSECFDFILSERHIDVRYARKIDQFFDMYGYQTNEVKLPNRAVRPHWTYTKTTNCTIDGVNDGVTSYGLPHDDAQLIQEIYNNGITFWKNINEIGDYSLAPQNVAGQG